MKTPFKDLGVVNFIQDKIGKKLKESTVSNIVRKATDGIPIVGLAMDLVLGSEPDVPANKFSTTDLEKLTKIAQNDQKAIDAYVELEKVKAELEKERLKAQNEETQSARDRELAVLNNENSNWADKNIMEIMAVLAWVGAIALAFVIILNGDLGENAFQLLTGAFTQLFAVLIMVYGYYFSKRVASKKE